MTFSWASTARPPQLLLVGMGTAEDLLVLPAAATRLAAAFGLPLRTVTEADAPHEALKTLAAEGGAEGGGDPQPNAWLAALPVDPGLPLAIGGSWAEALGAWRQPTVLLVSAAQLDTGLPAAGSALLERWRVPLVGLIQHGGPWRPGERRRDGLPWLGWLPGAEERNAEGLETLVALLHSSWRQRVVS